jgi:hypothetical protein
MEVILQSQSLLTHTLNTARNESVLTPQLIKDYNDALEKLETSVYPDIRKKYLKISHTNLISIMNQEQRFFERLHKVEQGIELSESGSSVGSNENPIITEESEL